MKVIFIADFFRHQILGGAESNDSALLSFLEDNDFSIVKKQSSECNLDFLNKNKDYFFIISNFVGLTDACKKFLSQEVNYIIYEHDHKYVSTRDPSKFSNFKIPADYLINVDFYKKAKAVVVLSKICKEILENNLHIRNVMNIGTSLWSDKKFDLLASKAAAKKTKKLGIIKSNNQIKGTQKAIEYCQKNNINFELIEPADEADFLDSISQYEQILFFPQVLETFCRVVAEAKILNCKVLTTPKLLGFYSETKLTDLSGEDLLKELKARTQKACQLFKNILEDKMYIEITK